MVTARKNTPSPGQNRERRAGLKATGPNGGISQPAREVGEPPLRRTTRLHAGLLSPARGDGVFRWENFPTSAYKPPLQATLADLANQRHAPQGLSPEFPFMLVLLTGRWNDLGLLGSHESNSLRTLRGISPHHMIFRACIRLVRSLISSRVARANLFMTNSGAIAARGSSKAPIFLARFDRRQRCRLATLGFAMEFPPLKRTLPRLASPSLAVPRHAQPCRAAPCPAVPSHAQPRPARPRRATPGHAQPCRVSPPVKGIPRRTSQDATGRC